MDVAPTVAPGELADPEGRLRALRRMKTVATGLLVAAAVVYVIARANEDRASWIGYVRAFSEAAMVGALADWFAVTALFKHPLGIPIPHTAIIPSRKAQIGRSLGEFVQTNFLTHDVLMSRLEGLELGKRFGVWLGKEENALRAAAGLADGLRGLVEVIDDADVQDAVQHAIEHQVRAIEVSPLVGRGIDVAIEGRHHERLVDALLIGLRNFLEENRTTFRARLAQESPWWVPEPLDDRIFNKIYTSVNAFLGDIGADPDHEVRRSMDRRIAALAQRLKDDPAVIERGEGLKEELLGHRDVQAWLAGLWSEMKGSVVRALDDGDSELRRRLAASLVRLGQRLEVDPELQGKVDVWVERAVWHIAANYSDEVSELISSTVARWDASDTSRRLELLVGRDLQFIRINGTLVGGLAGLIIYAFSQAFL